ncbi:Golgi CORVET complex core vacuolar protein 8-domain-containing protein [Paraphysoderma sedebokerense]|nr:Golgi CORVET complex core vacuolar protein 8-domain-containing protein [Paraphysoderma sedebokerense]
MVLIQTKPSVKTLYRVLRVDTPAPDIGSGNVGIASLAYHPLPSSKLPSYRTSSITTACGYLAFSWGSWISIVQLQYRISSSGLTSAKKTGKEGGKSYESGSDSGSSTRSEKKVRLEVTTIGEFNVGEGIMRCWWVDDKWLLLLTQSEQLHAFYAPTMSLIESSDIKDKRIQLQDWFLNVVKRLSPLAPSHSPPPFSSDLSNTSVQSRGVEISSKGGVVKEKIAVRGFSCTETWKEYDNRGSFLVLANDRLYISTLRPYTSRIKSLLVQQEYATALDLCHTLYLAYGPQSRKPSSSYSESLSASDDESAAPGVPILAVTGVPNDNNQFHGDLSELVRDVLVAWLTLIATSNDVLSSYAANGKEDEDQQVKEILRSWVNICSDMNMMDVLFSDVYECLVSSQPLQNWLDLFYGILSSLILPKTSPPLPTPSSPSLPLTLPPNVLQDLLRHIALEGNYSKFEDLILNIPEPELLDLNFVWAICKSHRLWHAATYISAWVVRDWVGTFCELIFALADLMTKNKTNGVTEDASGRQSEEKNVKQLIFDYLFSVFGDKRPPFVNLSSKDSEESKLSLLRFIFSPTYISVSSILSATSSSLQASSHSPSNTTIELTTLPLPYRKSRGTQSINNESEYPYIKFLIYLNPLKFYRVLETAFKNDEIWKAIGQNQPHNIDIPFSPTTNRFPFISPFDQSSSLNLSTSASSVNSTTRITKQWIIDTLISLYPYDELNRNRLDVLRKSDVEEDMLGVEMLALYSFIGKIVVECKDDVVLRDQVLHDIFLMLTSVSVNANDVYDEELDTFLHSERQDAIINLLSLLSLDTTSQSHILELCQSSKLFKVLIWVYTRQRRFDMVIQCYLSDSQLSPVVFNVINGLLGDIELSLDVKKEVRKVVIDEVMKLADIDVKVLANMVKLFMIENVDLIWSKLKETKFEFEFLQAFVEGIESSSSNADVELSTDIASSEDDLSLSMDNERCLIERLDMPVLSELVERYIALLARRQPKSVFPFLLQLKSPIYRSEKVLKIIRECGIVDATAWLLEKQGKVSEALDGVLKVVKGRSRFWLQPVESSHTVPAIDVELSENEQTNGEEGAESTKRTVAAEGRKNQLGEPVYKPSAKPALIKINAILKFAIQLCQRNSVADSLETIQLWFKLLDTFLLLQKSIKSAIPILPTKEAPSNQIILLSPIHAFTHFIQTIMESMFGYVSLPPFLSQLIQQQSSAASFGEFRYIILPMLDSYHHEFNLYNTTSRLINADLFKSFHSLYRRLLKPVKVRKQICGICKEILVGSSSVNMNIWNYRQRIDEIDESRTTRKVVVFQCDHGFHKDCMENQLLNGIDEYDEMHKTIGFGVCVLCGPEQIRRLKRKQLAGKQKVRLGTFIHL